ncbi:DUF3971 domain-containing protein [Yoonia sp. 208BN28-4]
MTDETSTTDAPETDAAQVTAAPVKRGRHVMWHGLRVVWLLAFLPVVFALIAAVMLIERDISAPSWIKSRVAAAASDVLGGDVSFGEIYVNIGRDLHPTVKLVNTSVTDANGARIARIAQISGLMSPRGLVFQQEVLMQNITLSGARIDLQRNANGSVALSFGEGSAAGAQQAGRLTGLLDQADQVLEQPGFAALETIRAENLIVDYTDLRAGRRWTVDGGTLTLDLRDARTELRADVALLSGGAGVTTLVLNYASPRGTRAADLGLSITGAVAADIATQSPALSWLGDVDAPLSATLRTTLDDSGELGPLSATLEMGEGVLQPNAATAPIAFDSAKMYLVLDSQKDQIRFDQVEVASSLGSFTATGQAFLGPELNGLPQSLVGQLAFRDLDLRPSDALAAPLDYDAAQVDLRLNLEPFSVDIGQFYLEGTDLTVHGNGSVAATDAGWRVALDVQSPALLQTDVLALWPLDVQPWLRGWITDNLDVGALTDLYVALRSYPDQDVQLSGHFGFDRASVRYLPDMPQITDASGIMNFGGPQFAVSLDQGRVTPPEGGVLNVAGSTFAITDTLAEPAPATLDLRISGSMAASMSLIDQPPFLYADWLGIPIAFAEGRAQTRVQVDMPMTSEVLPEQIRYQIDATIEDFSSDWIVTGSSLSADRLVMAMDNAGMSVTGDALFAGIPVSGVWRQPFAPGSSSTVSADMTLSQATLDAFDVALPPGSITGRGPADLDLTINPRGSINYRVTSNLRGVGVSVPALGWSKGRNSAADFRLVGTLGNTTTIDRIAINGDGLEADGRIVLNRDGSLDRAVFSKLRVGNWLNAPVTLRGRGGNRAFAVAIQGGALDLRRADFGGEGDGGPLTIALDRLQITDDLALTRFAGEFDGGGGLSGTFTALLNGEAAVAGTIAPQNGGSAVRIRSDNAGDVIRAAGLAANAVGGTLDLGLVPTGATGTYDGTIAIRRIRVRDAPAMAALLDAVSVVGALQQLDGQGLAFEDVDARFRLTPNQLILTQSSAVGAGLGISLDGIYTLANGAMDFQGVISPFYLLNGIGSVLTRQGEGLIGFNFNLYGNADAPQLSVNPFSALTPGMFREIFRRPPPEVTQ